MKPVGKHPAADRRVGPEHDAALRAGLTPEQRVTLDTMEQFGWTLRFVRRPLFLPPVPVVFADEGERLAVVEEDGTINEKPAVKLRG